MNPAVMIFSVDSALQEVLERSLTSFGLHFDQFREKSALLGQLGMRPYQYVVLDSRAVGEDMDVVSLLRGQGNYRILWVTPAGELGRAADAIRRGADFYLPVPVQDHALAQLWREWGRQDQAGQWHVLPAEAEPADADGKIIGRSEALKRVFAMASRVAVTDSPVLITGETGVGKEQVARTIHRLSDRAHRTFVAVNCGAIPENLIESELFGFRKGAFTGANSDRPGLFEQANGGTFFLDEVGELSPNLQVKLLRVLEEDKIRPLGAGEEIQINVRILAATNRDLFEATQSGKFRLDLFYRLNVIQIHISPLRERREDIPPLIKFFLEKYNDRFRKNVISISRDALFALIHYDYPGNVRELENIIQHGVLLADENVMTRTSLPPQVFQKVQLALEGPKKDETVNLEKAEASLIKQALLRFKGNQSETSRSLGISRSTLWRKIKSYHLESYK